MAHKGAVRHYPVGVTRKHKRVAPLLRLAVLNSVRGLPLAYIKASNQFRGVHRLNNRLLIQCLGMRHYQLVLQMARG